MIKVVRSDSFNFDMPSASLVNLWSRGVDQAWMTKRAAVLTDVVKSLRPEKGHQYIHLITMGSQEAYGPNRNGDGFNEKRGAFEIPEPKDGSPVYQMDGGLTDFHKTFTKHAHVFKHHKNTDPKLAIGSVKADAYNPEMKRGELIIKVAEDEEWTPHLQKLANGEDIPFSMACVSDPDYPVSTLYGYKRIADVTKGDLVLTHAGRWMRVKAVNRRVYTGELVKFHVNGLPLPLEVTADHPMWAKVFSGSRELAAVKAKAGRYFRDAEAFNREPAGWAHAEHVNVGDRFFYQPVTKFPGFGRLSDVGLAKLLGYYVAEGSLSCNGERACTVSFTCHIDDNAVRDIPALIAKMYPDIDVNIRSHRNSDACVIVDASNTHLAEGLRLLGGQRAERKRIAPEVFNAEMDVKLAFLGAWLDGDGWVDKKGVHWSTCNLHLALQGRDLLASIGVSSSIYKIDHAKCETSGKPGSRVEYVLNVSHLDAANLTRHSRKAVSCLLYADGSVRRKPACLRPCPDGRYAYRIKQVERRQVTSLETYNIEVEEDESYLLAGMISHNCKVPYDVCTICGNKAKSRAEYCKHAADNMTEILKEGHQVYVINDRPKFFDISRVFRPADRIAWSLRKVASAGLVAVKSGAELAEEAGLILPERMWDAESPHVASKMATAKKLAAIEKLVDGSAQSMQNAERLKGLACGCPESAVPPEAMEILQSAKLGDALKGLADAKICLSLRDFIELVMGSKADSIAGDIPAAMGMLPGVFSRLLHDGGIEECAADSAYDPARTAVPRSIREALGALEDGHSMSLRPAKRRMQITIIRGETPNLPDLSRKTASLSASASAARLTKEYAKYQLAYARSAGDDELVNGLTVLRNYAG